MTGNLPEGIVTFLFTDIEGSTRLVAEVGDAAYRGILDAERSIVLEAATAEGGVLFGSEGDAHFVAFAAAGPAIRAAVAAQRALAARTWAAGPVRVRMGIHTGEVQVVGDDYLGLEVHRAARVSAAGHGGQVLATDATRALAGDPGDGVSLRDLGEHRLKDLARPERLFQVEAPGLDAVFPPLRTLDVTPNNLPLQLTPFVGRAELATSAELLRRTRLLTLTGPGGTGKTRLSLALAGDCVERFPDGAWFIPLAPVTDPELVASAIAASIGLLAPNRAPIDRVRDHFRDRTAILVLDNFEQVVSGAPVVADLLRSAPKLTVIVSSRAPLRIAGEQEFPVPPLSLPPPGVADVETAMASEAVRLFVERAVAVRPDFALTEGNTTHVAEIVRRLDGLPLAIELAAARIRLLSPAAMAQRLGDRLGLLGAGGRDLPERQRTLRGAIDWSHDLLEDHDRRLFARLGVFAGGAPLEVAEAVCGIDGDEVAMDVLGGIERLAEQSLVGVGEDVHGTLRFTMLETIREYALEKLGDRGETAALRDRHADAFIAFVDRSSVGGEDRRDWLQLLEDEHDNIRAALDHLVSSGDRERASRLVFAVWRFWQARGHIIEGRRRADQVLAMPGRDPAGSRARLRALEAGGGLAYWAGDIPAAAGHYAEAEAEARSLGDASELANALYNRFFANRTSPDLEDWVNSLADDSQPYLREALEIWTRLGDDAGKGKALWALAEHHAYRRETVDSEARATEALEIFERLGDTFGIGWAHFTRALGRVNGGNLSGAGADFATALRDFQRVGDVSGMVVIMAALSGVLVAAGRIEDAYRMAGAARRSVAETGIHLAGLWPRDLVPAPDPATTDDTLRTLVAEGAAWSRDDAVVHAIALADELAAGAAEGSRGLA